MPFSSLKTPITPGGARIRVVDSHTAGEPTRVVVAGGPDLGGGSAAEQLSVFQEQFDRFRSAIVNEPRGSDVLVGALLTTPVDPGSVAGVIFFNNVGPLGMCGHGTIGVVTTLAYLGRIGPGDYQLETPVGTVAARLHDSGEVSVQNVPSYRTRAAVEVEVDDFGPLTGDVAWGGNWFFLVEDHRQTLEPGNTAVLTEFALRVRRALDRSGITGSDGHPVDHVELCGPSPRTGCSSRSFVLCPGGAYDRSPCGTGTSARLACLFADGKIREGEVWRQESITGGTFDASIRLEDGVIIPTIRGRAFINAESALILDPSDPYCWGIR